ncbi:hypothetical protein L211DRAFT_835964, partial [Terfezia boudieri ATCC MYA-4762]
MPPKRRGPTFQHTAKRPEHKALFSTSISIYRQSRPHTSQLVGVSLQRFHLEIQALS